MSDQTLDRIWEISDKYCVDYPELYACNDIQRLYAIEQTLEGTMQATVDLHERIKDLELQLSESKRHQGLLADAIGYIAKVAMVISPDAELTGPLLLLVADDCVGYIGHLESQLEWISVEDRLPENLYSYDVWVKSKDRPDYDRRLADVSYYNDHFETTYRQQPVIHPEYISHWMPRPKPPNN